MYSCGLEESVSSASQGSSPCEYDSYYWTSDALKVRGAGKLPKDGLFHICVESGESLVGADIRITLSAS